MKNLFKLTLTLLVGMLASFAWGSGAVYAQDDDTDVDRYHQIIEPPCSAEVVFVLNRVRDDAFAHFDYSAVMPSGWRLWAMRKDIAIVSPIHTSKSKGFNPALDWPALQDC